MANKKEKEFSICFPQGILELAHNFREQRLKKEEIAKQKEKERKSNERRVKTQRIREGLLFAKKVFQWASSFRKSLVAKELMRVAHIPTAYHSLFFFDGRVGDANWVGLVVSPKELILDKGGRYAALTRKAINSPLELASSVDTRILREACEWIDDGRVWECIERRFDYLKERKRV